uniref:Sema domain-containing protein n=1 Tax=Oryzias sinensis TaxID=183150 RepID=A0A8C7XJS2_9TELE
YLKLKTRALTDGCLFADSSHRPVRSFRLQNVTTLFLSSDSSTLYVGARDAILSLDVSQMLMHPDKPVSCLLFLSLRLQVDCPNFVHVLLPLNSTHLYACGSHAYSPQDAFIVGPPPPLTCCCLCPGLLTAFSRC